MVAGVDRSLPGKGKKKKNPGKKDANVIVQDFFLRFFNFII